MEKCQFEGVSKTNFQTAMALLAHFSGLDDDMILLGTIKVIQLKYLIKDYLRMSALEVKTRALADEKMGKKFSQSNCQLGLPNFPHPFVYAMDALITDSALEKETIARLKVAVKYFNDPSYF